MSRYPAAIPQKVQHILFWVAFLLFNLLINSNSQIAIWKSLLWILITMPLTMALVYFHLYVLVPKFLLNGRYLVFFTIFISVATGFVFFDRYLNNHVVRNWFLDYPLGGNYRFFNPVGLYYTALYQYSVVFLAIVIHTLKQWFETMQRSHELEIQKKTGEIALLRMQINPHFLFNTLNNIHVLIGIDRKKAEEAVVMLSDIMRYMLYDAAADRVPLEQEIQYLESYIALQKLRLEDPEMVDFSITGNINGRVIAPVILIPFVENAFKHALKDTGSYGIVFRLVTDDRFIMFESENSCKTGSFTNDLFHGGLGLDNVKRRLELLYQGKYQLRIHKEDSIFKVHLTIEEPVFSGITSNPQ